MLGDRRKLRWRFRAAVWSVAFALVLSGLSACTVAAGGGVLAALVGISALTSHCYDYVDVTVLNAQGQKTCAATVTASRAKSNEQFELQSCYYAPLSDGHWTLRAAMPGLVDAVSAVDVEHEDECTRHVQSVQLTLNLAGTRRPVSSVPPASTARAPAPPESSLIPPLSALAPAPNDAPTSGGAGAPSTEGASQAGAPSVGVFPNQLDPSQ